MDFKLLYDIEPYKNAYGHIMSNLLYHYKIFNAANELSKGVYKQECEYFERVLRSFLITKNIAYSKQLVSKDMHFSEKECKSILYKWDEYQHLFKSYEPLTPNPEKKKSDLLIRCENYEYAYPDATFLSYLFQLERKELKQIQSSTPTPIIDIKFIINVNVYAHKNDFTVSCWRNNSGWNMSLREAVNAFPEIKNIIWDEIK